MTILLHSPTDLTGYFGKICTIFSNDFAQNFSNSSFIATMNGDSFTLPCIYATLSMINTDLLTVRTALAQLCDYAAESDGLPAIFFNKLAYWIAVPLTKAKGHKADLFSYRSISLTAVVSKVLQRIVVQQVRDYLISNELMRKERHAWFYAEPLYDN